MKALGYDYESDDDEPTQRLVRSVDLDVPLRTRAPPSSVLSGVLRLRYLFALLLVANAVLIGVLDRYGGVRAAPSETPSRSPRDCRSPRRPLVTTSATTKTSNSNHRCED
jgi:hypothetical protein